MGQQRFSRMVLEMAAAALFGLGLGNMQAHAGDSATAQAPADCNAAFAIFRTAADAVLDAALHSQDDYEALHAARYAPALSTALAACKGQVDVKQAVYNTDFKLKTYDSARDLAIQMLQEKPPAPTD